MILNNRRFLKTYQLDIVIMTDNNEELLSKTLESFSIENKLHVAKTDPMKIINQETQLMLASLKQQLEAIEEQLKDLHGVTKSITDLSADARVGCKAKMSKYVEVDALLNTSEFKLKFGSYSVISSLRMVEKYCQKSVDEMQEEIKILKEHILRIEDQRMLVLGLSGKTKQIIHGENNTVTVYENGLVDIVESEPEPVATKERVARFKTSKERDDFFKSKDNNRLI